MKQDSLAHAFRGGKLMATGLDWAMAAAGAYFLLAYLAVRDPGAVAWMLPLPFFPIAVAAAGSRRAVWVRSTPSAAQRHRARAAVLTLAVPPLIDLACRAAGLQPALAPLRTDLTLACSSTLALLAAMRLRVTARPEDGALEGAGESRTEPREYLQFASGVAHELNNPLMAVAGWTELTMRRGAAEPRLRQLLEATDAAAATVRRLHRLVRSEGGPEGAP
jgi:signal transduction histidine kinase